MREGRAILQGDPFDGNERHHIGGANAGMDAGMGAHIDHRPGRGDGAIGGFLDGCGLAGESHHGAIMVGVHFRAEQGDTRGSRQWRRG